MRLVLSLMLGLALGLTACAQPTVSAVGTERLSDTAVKPEDYKLGVDDKIRAIVFNEPSLSGEFQVGSDGTVAMPLIGNITAAGKTVSEVAEAYRSKLAEGYVLNPRVSLEIISFRPFYILGEVRTPGAYPFATGLTVMNAIATAQGLTPRGDRRVVFIRRSGETLEKAYALTPDLKVLPGDTIRLGERLF